MASEELIDNLKSQFEGGIDSLEYQGISPIWKIKINKTDLNSIEKNN